MQRYPGGREFAFTILDDTDDATVANVKPLYDLLFELGLRTTKTVWPLDCPEGSANYFAGITLADPNYLRFAHELHDRGFELTWHAATMESSTRERTIRGLEVFKQEFGNYPALHCNHGENLENIYWGEKRYRSPLLRLLHRAARRGATREFSGDEEGSAYFWGDLCRRYFRFVRGFTWHDINTLRRDPDLVYRLAWTPYVDCWFSASDATNAEAFKKLVTRESVDRLRAERGVCILSTHLGKGYVRDGRVDPAIEATLRYVASQPGWFVPVSTILEHFRGATARLDRPYWRHGWYEMKHVLDRIVGTV